VSPATLSTGFLRSEESQKSFFAQRPKGGVVFDGFADVRFCPQASNRGLAPSQEVELCRREAILITRRRDQNFPRKYRGQALK
jgi:hypothetical protein